MSRRIIPVLCALAVAVVPATALAQPAQDPSPVVTRGGVVYGDTKYDLQNQQDQQSATSVTAYDQAISGDTKGNLPRAIAPAGTPAETPAAPATPVSTPTASDGDNTNGWQIAALAEAAFLAALALGAAALVARRQHRAPHVGV